MNVNAFRSERVVVAIKADGHHHKIIQIAFSRDGSLYVTFPYFTHKNGILAVVTVRNPPGSISTIDLAETGKVASHLVKYSHHQGGRAHFSQDGKVKTTIKRQSVALDDQHGHIFTVLIQGLSGFTQAQNVKNTPQRTTLTFDIPDRFPKALRIVGRWYWLEDLRIKPRPIDIGPVISTMEPDGIRRNAFIVANPNRRTEHVLLLTCTVEKAISPTEEVMMFYGGFDPPEVTFNPRKAARFLAFLYPANDFEALKKRIGSIDFTPAPATLVPSQNQRKPK
jgi:hypothetical protein